MQRLVHQVGVLLFIDSLLLVLEDDTNPRSKRKSRFLQSNKNRDFLLRNDDYPLKASRNPTQDINPISRIIRPTLPFIIRQVVELKEYPKVLR